MSIYCHLCCKLCQEAIHIKDADSDAFGGEDDKKLLGQFLEKHHHHPLIYTWEDDSIQTDDGKWIDPVSWPRFKTPTNGWWSCGRFYDDPIEQEQTYGGPPRCPICLNMHHVDFDNHPVKCPTEKPMIPVYDISEILTDLTRRHHLAIEKLTEAQFVEAIRQALPDFVRYVHADSQTIVNFPGAEAERYKALYHELLMSVESVTPGETRHQTALRYLTERESEPTTPDQPTQPSSTSASPKEPAAS